MNKESIYKKIGKNIQEQRILKGYTQEQLAFKINKGLNFMGKIEIAYSYPSLNTLIDIANALEIPLAKLLDITKK